MFDRLLFAPDASIHAQSLCGWLKKVFQRRSVAALIVEAKLKIDL